VGNFGSDQVLVVTLSGWLTIFGALVVLALLGVLWWRRRQQLTPEEREKLRRLGVNSAGRLTDGVLVDSPYKETSSGTTGLVFYQYSASGVRYTAAQDVSNLADRVSPESVRPGGVTAVKYDPRKPSNSIIVCEEWSGLRRKADGKSRSSAD
jgi:LPXTG-motif cell wall-anchored protein